MKGAQQNGRRSRLKRAPGTKSTESRSYASPAMQIRSIGAASGSGRRHHPFSHPLTQQLSVSSAAPHLVIRRLP